MKLDNLPVNRIKTGVFPPHNETASVMTAMLKQQQPKKTGESLDSDGVRRNR